MRLKNSSGVSWLLAPTALFLSTSVASLTAGELLDSRIDTEGGHYLLHIDMRIQAMPHKVYALLTDYAHLDRLSRNIVKSELLERHSPHAKVRLTAYGCIGPFCRKVMQVQEVTEHQDGYIEVKVIPELSDLRYGRNLWHVRADKDMTRVTFSSDMEPDFWIPPLLGTLLFKKKLLKESRAIIDNLEQLANSPHDKPRQ